MSVQQNMWERIQNIRRQFPDQNNIALLIFICCSLWKHFPADGGRNVFPTGNNLEKERKKNRSQINIAITITQNITTFYFIR